jgi:hypothetical protein
MIQSKKARIIKEIFSRPGIKGFLAEVEGREEKCIAYDALTEEILPGDEVLLNTTAMALSLGSGGYHYIISKTAPAGRALTPGGHIMKLRYTPMQIKVLAVEEEDSPWHKTMAEADSLEGIPVLAATLHSMLAPICVSLAARAKCRIAYVMTDGAALPLAFSQNVEWLRNKGLLVGTVTCGHAFGGDLEAVNIYSAMLAARHVLKADVIIVSMGPGIVGTGTKWGFTGVEQGDILNAVDSLGGVPLAVPRISFADKRDRHYGISHHSLTVLSRICKVPVLVPLPFLDDPQSDHIMQQLRSTKLMEKHKICMEDASNCLALMQNCELKMTTMGRSIDEDRAFFLSLGAAALTAARLAEGKSPHYLRQA